jgi:Mn2+/Fe2+ NRAMP family transporter
VLTGVIGVFIVVACASTLHVNAITINDAGDAAGALKPLAGHLAARLFGLGFLGAALLAACIVASGGSGFASVVAMSGSMRMPAGRRTRTTSHPSWVTA